MAKKCILRHHCSIMNHSSYNFQVISQVKNSTVTISICLASLTSLVILSNALPLSNGYKRDLTDEVSSSELLTRQEDIDDLVNHYLSKLVHDLFRNGTFQDVSDLLTPDSFGRVKDEVENTVRPPEEMSSVVEVTTMSPETGTVLSDDEIIDELMNKLIKTLKMRKMAISTTAPTDLALTESNALLDYPIREIPLDDVNELNLFSKFRKPLFSSALNLRKYPNGTKDFGKLRDKKFAHVIPRLAKIIAKVLRRSESPDHLGAVRPTLPPEVRQAVRSVYLESLSLCDHFQKETATCWFERQVGDTLTFSVRVRGFDQNAWKAGKIEVQWEKYHHMIEADYDLVEYLYPEFSANESWNEVLGSGGLSMRISPIMDGDMDYNSFHAFATAVADDLPTGGIKLSELIFRINILPIDMGYVYLGEELTINIRNYITLPADDTLRFVWMFEKSPFQIEPLPPNIRVKDKGETLTIRELSAEQHGIVTCGVYSPTNVFIAKRRFSIRVPALPVATQKEILVTNIGETSPNLTGSTVT